MLTIFLCYTHTPSDSYQLPLTSCSLFSTCEAEYLVSCYEGVNHVLNCEEEGWVSPPPPPPIAAGAYSGGAGLSCPPDTEPDGWVRLR